MTEPSARAVVEAFIRAIETKDFPAAAGLLTDDYIDEMPQSGELTRGRANFQAIAENYPGGVGTVDPASRALAGADDRWVMTPSFSILRIEGSGNTFTYTGSIRYPGSDETWQMVVIAVVRDGKIAKTTSYYAAPFEAPAWRAPFVERMRT